MKKLLILGSVVSPCPPEFQGGTERVAYYQAKHLARLGWQIIFVGAVGTRDRFAQELEEDGADLQKILENVDIVEIGGGTGLGTQADAKVLDPSQIEGSRKMRLESVYMSQVVRMMHARRDEYDVVLNNMRFEGAVATAAHELGVPAVSVMHLNLFDELASLYEELGTRVITISNVQREKYPDVQYLRTIYNPVNTRTYTPGDVQKKYALMMGTVGRHKNQSDAIEACRIAQIPLVMSGKIRDQDYFESEIKPHIDGKNVIYRQEVGMEEKLTLYRGAQVFLFPISWSEPFGLVCIEALSCGTPVIAYPHGGPAEIVREGVNGYLVQTPQEMAEKIGQIEAINRNACREDAVARFDEEVIGQQYFDAIAPLRNS